MFKNVILILVGVVFGVGATVAGFNVWRSAQIANVAESTGLNLEHCNGLDAVSRGNCVNNALLNDAVRKQDAAVCQHISDEAMQGDCSRRLAMIANLGTEAAKCKGQSAESLCYDITALMAAVESRESGRCNVISSPILVGTCNELITGQKPVAADVVVTAPRSRYSYGLQCDSSDPVCAKNKRDFNNAVRANDLQACERLETANGLCAEEALFYRAYQSGDYAGCVERFEVDAPCRTVVTIAKAVDAGNSQVCDALPDADRIACQQVVQTNKEKRFEYLNEAL